MALPSHSPSHPFSGPGSPPRALNGYSEAPHPSAAYGPVRTMLPPSPQHYPSRFHGTSAPPPPQPFPSLQDVRTTVPPYKRPGSSMSISSMLGGEPEKPHPDPYFVHHHRVNSQPASMTGPPFQFNAAMSPPQQPAKFSHPEHTYLPRSRTPDRFNAASDPVATRQRSSSSGTTMQRLGVATDFHNRSASSTPGLQHSDHVSAQFMHQNPQEQHDRDERTRRTSLSGILQRPSSQPQPGSTAIQPLDAFRTQPPLPPATLPYDRIPPPEPLKQNATGRYYDTRPPALNGLGKPAPIARPSPPRSSPHSTSPEIRRSSLNGNQARGLVGLLNGPVGALESMQNAASQIMSRQDSTQSQGERSILGERAKFRAYSPFAGSFTSNPDEQGRKGSDELSQHRAILALAGENKRGRYSPLPQAVHGAQAQTPVLDGGSMAERGRVFSGIGSGIGASPTPGSQQAGSMKRDDGPMKLSEDNLKTLSRSGSGTNKRSRKTHEDDVRDDADGPTGERGPGRKRGKHQHNYKADLEEMATNGLSRRDPVNSGYSSSKPLSLQSAPGSAYHHHHQRNLETAHVPRPRKVVKVASVFNAAAKSERRHLGNFTYQPTITQPDSSKTSTWSKFGVSITPNLLPSFGDPEQINCTYTIHVPRIWLHARERALIGSERYLWGSGIYTDDSDPVAAAIHSGFVKGSIGDGVDAALLSKVIDEQNPVIEYPRDIEIPKQPFEVELGKDLNITMVVLPLLEKYEGTARFGIKSRSWPDSDAKVPHDGVSFGILRVDFVDIGSEEIKVGRTGQGRRERLRLDLEARRRGLELEQQKIADGKKRRAELLSKQIRVISSQRPTKNGIIPKSVPDAHQTNRVRNAKTNMSTVPVAA